jgi:ATP-binding cassette subfamily B protein
MSDARRTVKPAGPAPRGGRAAVGFGRGLVEKPKNMKKTVARLFSYFGPRRRQIVTVAVLAALSTAFSIVGPKLMGEVTTKLFEGLMGKIAAAMTQQPLPAIDFIYIGRMIVLLIALYLVSAALGYAQQYLMSDVSQNIVFDLRRDTNDKLQRLPLKYFDTHTHGEVMSRVTNDIDTIGATLQQSLTQLITSVCTIIGVLVMMLTISPLLTLIALLTVPAAFLGVSAIMKRSQRHFASQQKNLGILNGHVEEMYSGFTVVKAFCQEQTSIRRFEKINEDLTEASWRAQFVSGIVIPMMNFMNNLGYVLVCVIGGILTARKVLKLGDIQAFIQYSRQLTMPISQVASITNTLQSALASAERVFEVLDEMEEQIDQPDAVRLRTPRGHVVFRNVRFGYSDDVDLMKNINIDVEAGETVAIVGPTGAGKTTLVNLLMRFYELQGGAILVDGTDIRTMRRGELRRLFGMVLQDTWLFSGTIRDNIAYGREGATDSEVIRAAIAVHADHLIRALPEGYDTVIDEDASNLSQGEKQLLTIARALLSEPLILILDEATSSVDTRTEVYIQKAMQELMKGRTNFVIAHRLSTIRDSKLILVMNKGDIIETGNHKELLARGGFYADLYQSQFAGAAVDDPATTR